MAPFHQSVRLHEAFSAAGAPIELEAVEGAEHFFGGVDDDAVRGIFARTIAFAQNCVA
jgi:hypothetical protein